MSTLRVPDPSLVVLIGASGSGKSTFARTHFLPTEIVSSDVCRGLVADDENDQTATGSAFELVHFIVGQRLAGNRLTVVDATSVQVGARKSLVDLARAHHTRVTAIVFDLPQRLCEDRNAQRPDRDLPPHVVRQQVQQLRRSLRGLGREGFQKVHVLRSPEDVDQATITREPLWNDQRGRHGPFDVIGDIHGCHDELVALLAQLGYPRADDGSFGAHPAGRTAVFLGDLVDRGPAIPDVLDTVMGMVDTGAALCIAGNHENKLGRALAGRNVKVTHGLAESLAQLDATPDAEDRRARVGRFMDKLVSHYVLDEGRLVVAHAGLTEAYQGRASGAVRSFALYGDTTGETDEYGLPVRYPWADEYRGRALVVYGHTPVPHAVFHNNTICVDTGCVFGGSLTALRYPERELVSVPAARTYYEPTRPLEAATPPTGAGRDADLLDVDDVLGKRIIRVGLLPSVTVQPDHATAALEVMSRFAVDPRWLVYLPPTMAPTRTSEEEGFLEHPREAFADFRADGVAQVVCEEKHMGSRAVVVVCRDAAVAEARFGITDPAGAAAAGVCCTRTGRSFFSDPHLERAFLDRVRAAADTADLWGELASDWFVLDAELLPWSFKAGELLRRQYAAVGAAASADARASLDALAAAAARGVDVGPLLDEARDRSARVDGFVAAYGPYCWDVSGLDDLRLAPFQVLAAEGEVLARRPHDWHLAVLGRLCAADPGLLRLTEHRVVDLGTEPGGPSEEEATAWWLALTAAGGEGMVVKPMGSIVATANGTGLVQPGIKCRGREYLRIIYGPEYDRPDHLAKLRRRRLGHKRSLALRELALGIEALDRFVARDALHRVHECVFAVLALETEPVDPRL